MEYNQAAKIIQTYWRLKYMSWLIYKKVGVKKIKKHLDWIDIWGFIIRDFKYRRYEKAHHFSAWFDGFLEKYIDFKSYCYNDAAKKIQTFLRLKYVSWLIYKKVGVKKIKEHLDYDWIFRFIVEPLRYNKDYLKFKNDLMFVLELG